MKPGSAIGRWGDQRTVRPIVLAARPLESVVSLPARASTTSASASVRGRQVHGGDEPGDGHRSVRSRDDDGVVAVRALDSDGVDGSVAGAARRGAFEVAVECREVGAGHVVNPHVVDAGERGEVDLLDVVEVHDDVAEVAEEPNA